MDEQNRVAEPEHVTRMRDENSQLVSRINKLEDFLHSEAYWGLSAVARALLEGQFKAMREYHDFLSARLQREGF